MSQLSLLFEAQGKQSVESRPIPEPRSGHLQIRVEAAAFSPADQKIYDSGGAGFIKKYPTVQGFDAAGVVTKVGADVTRFEVGDRVTFMCRMNYTGEVENGEGGAFQQYALADPRFAVKIPANVDFDSASTFPGNGVTAAGALYGQLKFPEPSVGTETAGAHEKVKDKIVILGGSSSVGSYGACSQVQDLTPRIRFAVLSGLEVTTTSSPAHFDYLKSLGASTVIDRGAPDAAAQILSATGGPVKYAVDAVSTASSQLVGVEVLQRDEGKLVLMLRANDAAVAAAEKKGVSLLGTRGVEGLYTSLSFWDALETYFARGLIKFNRPTVIEGGLRAWEKAFDLLRQGKVSGTKLVMRPQETE